ncbi:hypothetical protein [Vulcanococcus sp.]|uniref:hypothetical protein n=1 Tax=Vulcanococcus sp. TaxID=2856995 RepID=UPI003C038093
MTIEISATGTWHPDTKLPHGLTMWAQGDADDLKAFAARNGMEVVSANWDGLPLAVVEVLLGDGDHPAERARSMLGLFEQQGYSIAWLQDLAPRLHNRFTATNVYLSRADFLEAVDRLEGLVHA